MFSRKCCNLLSFSRGSTKWTECSTSSAGVATGATSTVRRIAEPFAGQLADLRRHGGGEHQRLPLARARADNPPQRHDEAHVEHLVGLVEDQNLDVPQIDVALLHQVFEPAGRGDEDVDAILQGPHLRPLPDAAVDDGIAERSEFAVGGEAGPDLGGQLARRRQHQRRIGRRAFAGRRRESPRRSPTVVATVFSIADACQCSDSAASAARRLRSCRCRFGRSPSGRAPRAPGRWPSVGWAWRVIALGANSAEERIGEAQISNVVSVLKELSLSLQNNTAACAHTPAAAISPLAKHA